MFKIVLLFICCFFCFGLFANDSGTDYLLSDTSRELYLTGSSSYSGLSIVLGEHQNLAISPNVYNQYGIIMNHINESEFKLGTLVFQIGITPYLLFPEVQAPGGGIMFKFKNSDSVKFRFNLPSPIEKLSIDAGPYLQFDLMAEYFPEIDNVGFQSFLTFTFGGVGQAVYSLTDTINLGLNFSTFLFGMDFGRNGYNKDFLADLGLSHFGNYMDLKISLFGSIDISRTESIRLEYLHSVNSFYGEVHSVISGENHIGIYYCRKMVR